MVHEVHEVHEHEPKITYLHIYNIIAKVKR